MGRREEQRQGGNTAHLRGISPVRVQGEEASGTHPLSGCLGAGTLYADHREGGSWGKSNSQPGVLEQVTRG